MRRSLSFKRRTLSLLRFLLIDFKSFFQIPSFILIRDPYIYFSIWERRYLLTLILQVINNRAFCEIFTLARERTSHCLGSTP